MKNKLKYLLNSFLIMLVGGTVYSYSIFKKPLEEYLNLSSSQSVTPFQIFLLLFAFSMPLSGYFIEKIGVKKTYLIASLMITFSWICSSFINSLTCFVFTYGILGGIGTGILYGVPLKIVSLWFYDVKGLATGITVAGFGLSSFITAQIFKLLILKYGILTAFFYFGIIVFFLLFICYFNVQIPQVSTNKEKESYHTGYEISDVLRDKRFYILYFFFVISCSFSLTAVSFTASYFIEFFKFDISKSSYILSFMAILNTLGRPIFGYITDRFGFYFSSLVSFVIYFIAGFIFVFFYNSLHATTVAFILLWFNLGAWLAIAPVSTMRFFGLLHYSKNYGIIYTAYGIGAFIGMNFMHFSNYNLFFYYIFYGSIVMIIIDLVNYKKLKYNF